MSSPDFYDAIIVGGGPAGSTTAYYLANGMNDHSAKRVAILDKATFPRDKYCGDAWCAPALDILEDMGILQQLEKDGLTQDCTSGGFVSPSGESYISTGEGPPLDSTRCFAIKREICDDRIVKKAAEVGADLFQGADFEHAELETDGLWTIRCKDGRLFRATLLVAADGATSQVARSLGFINSAPEGIASRQYIKGGTHNFKSGGVLFYPSYIIPGYVALFRHYNDDIDLGVYIIPGGAATPDNIISISENEVANDPFMLRLLGPNAEYLEKPRVASLRTGGVEKSTDKQFLAVGDAAGQTDPLTGEGIHTGMIGGKLAALRIHEMIAADDFSAQACAVYHQRWMDDFGKDFPASAAGAKMTYKYPLLLDAANVVAQRKGDVFMADFGATMTGVKPKSTFLRPGIALPLGLEVIKQFFKQKLLKKYPSESAAYHARAKAVDPRPTAFANAGLLDTSVEAVPREDASNNALDDMFQYTSKNTNARQVLVMYGTEYGFAQETAQMLCESLLECGEDEGAAPISPQYIDAEHHQLVNWNEVDACLMLCSTAGDGVPPQKAKSLFDFLESAQPDFSRIKTAVLAMGDSSYPHFCGAGESLNTLLNNCSAQFIQPLCTVDNEDMAVVNEWIDDMIDELCAPEFWQKILARTEQDGLLERATEYFNSVANLPVQANSHKPQYALIAGKRALANTEAGGKETVHIELDISSVSDKTMAPFEWLPGDALGVNPINAPDEVTAALNMLGCRAEEKIKLPRNRGTVTLHDALNLHCDIKNLKIDLFTLLREEASDEFETKKLKEKSADINAFLLDLELQDILKQLPIVANSISAQQLVDSLHTLSPRYYSIASSQAKSSQKVDLTVATVHFELADIPRVGVASTYLAERVNNQQKVAIFTHRNNDFRLPEESSGNACVMIGAGTGVAPYRAFMQELDLRASKAGTTVLEQSQGRPHLLFFGCRHESADFLYGEEWLDWQKNGSLSLLTAFSRDQKKKIYVQDRIAENSTLIWQRMEAGDHFYICGDATHMAVDVEKALLSAICLESKKSESEAQHYLDQLRKSQRYQKDVWA